MKLLTKTTLYIATLSLFLFFIMGIIFFQVLKNLAISDMNRELMDLSETVEGDLETYLNAVPPVIPGIDSLSVRRAGNGEDLGRSFGDTLVFDRRIGEYRTYRYLSYTSDQPSGRYAVKIFKSTTPADKLVERVTLMITLMVILFLAGIFGLNRFVFANLWRDFFNVLEKLRRFDTGKEPVSFGESDILEFKELKVVLDRMTKRLSGEFRELKEYTDHTTHELQTPLAVIRNKIELLMESSSLGPHEMQLLEAILASANRLTRLNSTLAMITRIENQQFTGREEIDLVRMVDHHLDLLQELISLSQMEIHKDITGGELKVVMDGGLADILVANLLKNAIVHGRKGGRIIVRIGHAKLEIGNAGDPLPFPSENLFRRFVRAGTGSGTFGLGLSLVKKICDSYGIDITYTYSESYHFFRLKFS